jgi:DNA-binding IscR family transcriptional regulator
MLPIFRSRVQAEVLTWLYLHPDSGQGYSLTDLAARVGASVPTIHREAERLVESGLVTQTILGRNRLLTANMSHPAAESLARLLEVTFGPKEVVAGEFADMPGADRVFIFGSWAARYLGEPGYPPKDIEVMVVGDTVDRGDLYASADRVQQRLGIPVNPVTRTHQQWDDPTDRLSAQLRTQSIVEITVEREEL